MTDSTKKTSDVGKAMIASRQAPLKITESRQAPIKTPPSNPSSPNQSAKTKTK